MEAAAPAANLALILTTSCGGGGGGGGVLPNCQYNQIMCGWIRPPAAGAAHAGASSLCLFGKESEGCCPATRAGPAAMATRNSKALRMGINVAFVTAETPTVAFFPVYF